MNNKDSGWILILIIVLAVLLLGPFIFMGVMIGPGMMGGWRMGQGMMGYGSNWIAGALQIILFLVFLGLIVFGVYYLISGGRSKSSDSSSDILKERYARGEINKEDYDRMKKELKED